MAFIKQLRSSLENGNTPLTFPSEWLLDYFNGGRTSAGIRVSEHTALQIPAVYACVRIISESVAALPLRIFEKVGKGREEATELPLYEILRYSPNPHMTAFSFIETLQGHLCLWGNAYGEIQRDKANRVVAIWPRHPYKTKPYRTADGELWYVTTDGMVSGGQRFIHYMDMLHLTGLSQDGLVGMSPIQQARQAMGLALAAEKYGAQFFGNGSRPGGILTHPKTLKDEAAKKLKESWQQAQGGDNAHSVAVLEEGIQWTAIGMSAKDSQFLETRKFQKAEIASIFRVPPHMLADLERSTHSNIEQQSLEFVIYTLMPWLVRWEQEIKRKLLPAGKPHGTATMGRNAAKIYFPEFAINALIKGDFKTRYDGYAIARQWGWMSANDVREQESMNPIEGGAGDIYLVPMNMVDADMVANPPAGSGLPGAPQLPEKAGDTPNDGTDDTDNIIANDSATGANDRNAQLLNRFVAGFYRIFRSAFSVSLTFDRTNKLAMYRCFAPVLTSLAEMFARQACDDLRVDPLTVEQTNGFVTNYLERMASRSENWTEENGDKLSQDELGKAVRTLSIAVYQEAATQKAKKRIQ
jgi:HK97 family phage portal protein